MANNPSNYYEIVNDILASANIVDVIGRYIKLQRKGSSYFGLCPFHNDTHPSLAVSPKKNVWKCFVCGNGGNVFSFVQKYEKITYSEAIKKVAELINYDQTKLEALTSKNRHFEHWTTEQQRLVDANKRVNNIYEGQLYLPESRRALNFLYKRFLTDEVIKFFHLGYAPNDVNKIHDWLINKDKYFGELPKDQFFNDDELIKTNIINEKYHPVLMDRITFPITNANGTIVAFSGRDISNTSEVKYLHSQNTEIFDKSKVLWNYQNAIKTDCSKLIIVEGFFDCISYHLAGYPNTVACMGTALTKDHLNLLHDIKDLKTVIIGFDNDQAGLDANIKNGKFLIENGFQVSVINYGDLKGKDADDIRTIYGYKKIKEIIDQRVDFISFYIQTKLKKKLPFDEQTNVVNELIEFIVNNGDTINRNKHLSLLASLANLDVNDLAKACDEQKEKAYKKAEQASSYSSKFYPQFNRTANTKSSPTINQPKPLTLEQKRALQQKQKAERCAKKAQMILEDLRINYESLIAYIALAPDQIFKIKDQINFNTSQTKNKRYAYLHSNDYFLIFKIFTLLINENPHITTEDLLEKTLVRLNSGLNNDPAGIYELAIQEIVGLKKKLVKEQSIYSREKNIGRQVDELLKTIVHLQNDYQNTIHIYNLYQVKK